MLEISNFNSVSKNNFLSLMRSYESNFILLSKLIDLDIVKNICIILDDLKPRKNKVSYSELISFVTDRPGHDFRYALDSSKIKNTGLDIKDDFNNSLQKTIEWYLENKSFLDWKK